MARNTVEISGIALMVIGGVAVGVLAAPHIAELLTTTAASYAKVWHQSTEEMIWIHGSFMFIIGLMIYGIGKDR